jgi:phosphoglycolate phosphatase-like HAD superfamily hydrolase
LGHSIERRDIFVIGDTVLDVLAGKALGAVTVAVDGHGKSAQIRASRPDLYLESLADPEPFLRFLETGKAAG